jgi:arsenate reductase (thioredoxin)
MRVLFLCTGNSCRSQMAEGWLRHLGGERFESLSAGVDPHGLNPLAVRVMAEAGVDISGQRSESIHAYLADPPDLVISVCDRAEERCPIFPGRVQRLRWLFPDPARAEGQEQEVLAVFRQVRDDIRTRIQEWLAAGAPCEEPAA